MEEEEQLGEELLCYTQESSAVMLDFTHESSAVMLDFTQESSVIMLDFDEEIAEQPLCSTPLKQQDKLCGGDLSVSCIDKPGEKLVV